MGIPFYFRTLIEKHPRIIHSKIPIKMQCLFFDFNSIIHQCSQLILKKKQLPTSNLVFQEIEKMVKDIVHVAKPTSLVYFGIDGFCPVAKMQQQRKRRYLKSKDGEWDSNCITPGTKFMEDLDQLMKVFCSQMTLCTRLKWIVSTSAEKGEGEHKIFNFIKTQRYNKCLIHGMDADLIMLSMICKDASIVLMRDNAIVSIDDLKTSIEKEYGISVNSYITLCILMGNDFLPSLSYLKIKNNDIEHIINVFKKVNIQNEELVDTTLNLDLMSRLINELVKYEDERMNDVIVKYNRVDQALLPSKNSTWRLQYYHKLFIKNTDVSKVCENYIDGLFWNIDYYYNNTTCKWGWYYNYNFSPTILDLNNQLKTHQSFTGYKKQAPEFKKDLQLLMVLPPSSMHLLRTERAKYIYSNKCVHLYPENFEILTFLKEYDWEYIPNLPKIDVDKIALMLDQ